MLEGGGGEDSSFFGGEGSMSGVVSYDGGCSCCSSMVGRNAE
jgi:hypothetical protein